MEVDHVVYERTDGRWKDEWTRVERKKKKGGALREENENARRVEDEVEGFEGRGGDEVVE